MHPNDLTINEYVDEALGPEERAAIDEHLRVCAECGALVADLRDLKLRASTLEPLDPPGPAWSRIDASLRTPTFPGSAAGARRTWPLTPPLRLAAAAMLAIATVVGIRWWQPAGPAATYDAIPSAQSVEAELLQAEQHYQKAISGLELIANSERGSLDPQTAATLQKNLGVIDQAINESRAALRAQPNSQPAQQSLLDSFKAKVALLQDTVALINEMRKGNEAGAARIVSGLKQKGT